MSCFTLQIIFILCRQDHACMTEKATVSTSVHTINTQLCMGSSLQHVYTPVMGSWQLCLTCDSFISSWASWLPYLSHKGCILISHIKGLLDIGAWGRAGAGQSGTVVSCCPPKAKAGLKVWSPLCVVVCKTIFSPPWSNGPHNVLVTVWSDGSVQYSIYTWIQLHMHS